MTARVYVYISNNPFTDKRHDHQRHNHYHHLEERFPSHASPGGTFNERKSETDERQGEGRGSQVQFRANAARMSDSREGRSRQTHPGGLGDENKLASEHQWWPCCVRFLSAEPKREVARLWLRLLRQKRRLTSLISDENENEFDPFFSLSPFLRRFPFRPPLTPFSHDPHHVRASLSAKCLLPSSTRLNCLPPSLYLGILRSKDRTIREQKYQNLE